MISRLENNNIETNTIILKLVKGTKGKHIIIFQLYINLQVDVGARYVEENYEANNCY